MASHKGCHCVDGHWSGSGEWRSKKKSIPKGLKRKKNLIDQRRSSTKSIRTPK